MRTRHVGLALIALIAMAIVGVALGGCGNGDDNGASVATVVAPSDAGSDAPLGTAAAPTFSPAAGTYTAAQSVTIATTTPNGAIYYTVDGTLPTVQSTRYSAPINVAQTTTITAFVHASGYADSPTASATYTLNIAPGSIAPVAFNPAAGTFNNDVLLSLSTATPGATICYTTDGSIPGCTAGVCAAGSLTYHPGPQVPVTGALTGVATSSATISALACLAGSTNTAVASQIYTLQVAAPTLKSPDAGTLAFRSLAYMPTASSTTTGAVAWVTRTTATPPTCGTGTQMTLPGAIAISPAAGAQAVVLIGCKAGYLPSAVTTANYAVQLDPPAFVPGADGGALHANTAVSVDNSANPSATTNSWVCASTDGSHPGCTSTACTTADAGTTAALQNGATITTLNTTGTTINAIACSSVSPSFVASTVASGTYSLQLDPIRFSPPSGTLIPVGPGSLAVSMTQNNPGGDKAYDFICITTNGTTVPDCTCTSAGQTKSNGTSTPSFILAGNTSITLQAVGCLNPANADKYLASAVGMATYPPAGSTLSPTILPAATTQNNDAQIKFVNNDTVATVDICYTTNGTAPTCGGTCTAATAPGATVNGPVLVATATTVRALACDVSLTKSPSAEVTPHPTYTLQVGDASIAPASGPLSLGSAVTFTSSTKNAVFHYTTNGATPNCATSPTLTATGADPGPYTAKYTFTGTETGGVVSVIACKANYTQSTTVASVAYTSALATPTFKYGTGTYDDTLAEVIRVSPGIAGTWLCLGAGATCGATVNTCSGAGSTPVSTTTTAGVSSSSATSITTSGQSLSAIACAMPASTVVSSASASATYTLQTSGIRFTPAAGSPTSTQNISVSLLPSTMLPQGDGVSAVGVSSTTELCVSKTASPPPQPAPCSGFTNSAWTCATGGGTSGLGAGVSPIIAFADVGTNLTLNAFTCRDGFVYQTGTAVYTFAAYKHTIAMTGAVQDFTPATEQIATADAGAFAYVSWDTNNLYIGFDKGVAFASSDYVHFYIGGASGGTQTPDTLKVLSPQSLPSGMNAAYHVWWKVDNTDTGADSFGGTSWAAASITPTIRFNQGSTFVEVSIPLTAIGNPTDIHLAGSLWTGAANRGSWPVGSGTPTTDVAWNNFQDDTLGAAYAPNDPNRLNQQ